MPKYGELASSVLAVVDAKGGASKVTQSMVVGDRVGEGRRLAAGASASGTGWMAALDDVVREFGHCVCGQTQRAFHF